MQSNAPILTTHQVNNQLDAKLDLFISQMAIKGNSDQLKSKIKRHLNQLQPAQYVLFRHSSLYFFSADSVDEIEKTHDKYQDKEIGRAHV